MSEEDKGLNKITHVVILDSNGNRERIIEPPPDVTPENLEFLAADKDVNIIAHIPFHAGLPPFDLSSPAILPIPSEKIEKELFLGKLIAPCIRQMHNLDGPIEVSTNSEDPPDLLLTTPTKTIGIELCELIYPERHLNNNLLQRFEGAIRRKLPKDSFFNYQLNLSLKYASNGMLRLPKGSHLDTVISELIQAIDQAKLLTGNIKGAGSMLPEESLPESCRPYMQLVILDNIGPPSNLSHVRPVIRFANHSQEFSKNTLRSIVNKSIKRKLDMKLAGSNILLIWSQHPSFRFCISETSSSILELLLDRMRSPFPDVLYLHRSTENILGTLMLNRQISVRVTKE